MKPYLYLDLVLLYGKLLFSKYGHMVGTEDKKNFLAVTTKLQNSRETLLLMVEYNIMKLFSGHDSLRS